MVSGPVASNHVNLKKQCYLPWLKGRYRVHAEVNGTEGEKGRTGTETDTGTEGAGRQERNISGNGEEGRQAQARRAGKTRER